MGPGTLRKGHEAKTNTQVLVVRDGVQIASQRAGQLQGQP